MAHLTDILRPLLVGALIDTARLDSGDGPPAKAVPPRAETVADLVLDRMSRDPELRHAANAEPWYRSRVTLGALLSAATPLIALAAGREITQAEGADLLGILTAAGTLLGAGVTLYGRWTARRPLGAAPSQPHGAGPSRAGRAAPPRFDEAA